MFNNNEKDHIRNEASKILRVTFYENATGYYNYFSVENRDNLQETLKENNIYLPDNELFDYMLTIYETATSITLEAINSETIKLIKTIHGSDIMFNNKYQNELERVFFKGERDFIDRPILFNEPKTLHLSDAFFSFDSFKK